MDGSRRGADRYAGSRNEPVRRNGKDRFGSRRLQSDTPPRGGVTVLSQRVHRISMAEENCWQHPVFPFGVYQNARPPPRRAIHLKFPESEFEFALELHFAGGKRLGNVIPADLRVE